MATAIDAKGDLVPGTGADTFARLAVGANGTVLTADSAEATGLKWAAGAGYAPDMFRVTKNGLQSFSSGTWTRITGWIESYDIGADFSTPAWTAPVNGYYTFSTIIRTYASSTAAGNRQVIGYYANGSLAITGAATSNMLDVNLCSTITLYFNAGETLEIYIYNDNSGSNVEASSTSWFGQFVRTP
jgi:hypothetical protein